MTSKSWISRLGAPLIALVLTVAPSVSPVHAVEDARKVSVVSSGLFGDQGVFRSEATGAAQGHSGPFRERPDQRAIQFEERRRCNDRSPGHVIASGIQWDGRRERRSVFDSHLARLPRRPCSQGGAAYANAHAV